MHQSLIDLDEIAVNNGAQLLQQLDLGGDIGGELHHLVGPASGIEDRVVGCLNPDFAAALAKTAVFPGIILAPLEARPQGCIVRAGTEGGVNEDTVMPADDLAAVVTHSPQEVLVGIKDRAIQREGNDSLRLVDRGDLPRAVRILLLLLGNVGREFDHLHRLAGAIEDRIVGRLDPDFSAAFGQPPILASEELPTAEAFPEIAIVLRFTIGRVNEKAVVTPDDLGQFVAHGPEEIGIGLQDRASEVKLDDRLHPIKRGEQRGIIRGPFRTETQHEITPDFTRILANRCLAETEAGMARPG